MPFPAQSVQTPTGFGSQTLPDWVSALQRLQEGRVSDPSQDKLYAVDPRYEPSLQPGIRGEVEAVPLGDIADPVSQLAFLLTPGGLSVLKHYIANALPRQLRASAVRDAEGQLAKLYHGTPRAFERFDVRKADPDALFGPGVYTTESPGVASGYVGSNPANFATWQVASQNQPNVRALYSSMRNPFDIEMGEVPVQIVQRINAVLKKEGLPQLSGSAPINGQAVYDILSYELGKTKANQVLAQAGFDGITHIGGAFTGTAPHRVYVAFDPKTLHAAAEVEGFTPYTAPPAAGFAVLPALVNALRMQQGNQ